MATSSTSVHSSSLVEPVTQPHEGRFLVSSSYDHTVRVWDAQEFKPVKTLVGHGDKVMRVDVSSGQLFFAARAMLLALPYPNLSAGYFFCSDGRFFASASYDRTFKIWAHESEF